jgi:hypothetical protein
MVCFVATASTNNNSQARNAQYRARDQSDANAFENLHPPRVPERTPDSIELMLIHHGLQVSYLSYRGFHSFSHSHYSAVLFERNLVHEHSHEVKSAPVSEKQPLWFGRIGDGTAIKAFSFIPHHNRYFPIHATSAAQMNLLVGIFTVSVNHSVGKSFEYGDFNVIFSLFCDAKFRHEQFNEPHELIYEWRDVSCTAGGGLT